MKSRSAGKAEPHIPARNVNLAIDSHGSRIYGRLLLPSFPDETSLCPVVLQLHGFPGNEQNIDLAQAIRSSGFAAVHFSYRGVWGSYGEYSFSHLIEDAGTAIDYLREHASAYRLDPEKLILLGHSMGGFAALNVLARGARVSGAVLIAPCDLAAKCLYDRPAFEKLLSNQKLGYFRTKDEHALQEDAESHAKEWQFTELAKTLPVSIPYEFIGGTYDTATPPGVHIAPVVKALRKRGAAVRYTELKDSHAFPDLRTKFLKLVVQKLKGMLL